jgi:hypothetical protein
MAHNDVIFITRQRRVLAHTVWGLKTLNVLALYCVCKPIYLLLILSFKSKSDVSPLLQGAHAIHLLYVVDDNKVCSVSKHRVVKGDSHTSGLQRAGY